MTPQELERAARWHARMADVRAGPSGDALRAAFSAWLQMSSEHRRAYRIVEQTDGVAREFSGTPELRAIADAALARVPDPSPQRRRWGGAVLIGALCIAPVAALTIRGWPLSHHEPMAAPSRSFATGVGERRSVNLGAYGRVTLDTATRIDVTGATLHLDGQAYVAAGSKPLTIVLRNGATVTATGDLNVRTAGMRATLLAERASVVASGVRDGPIAIAPGKILLLDGANARLSVAADPMAVTSWRDGWLMFDDVPLGDAAAEINRYRRTPIRLGPGAQAARISGSFRTDDATGFVKAVADAMQPSRAEASHPERFDGAHRK